MDKHSVDLAKPNERRGLSSENAKFNILIFLNHIIIIIIFYFNFLNYKEIAGGGC